MAADDNRFDPSWDGARNTLEDDWLAEDCAAEDVADLGTRESHVKEKVERPNGRRREARRKKSVYGSEVRMAPLREHHTCFNLNSFTRSSSGPMVTHLIPTLHADSSGSEVVLRFIVEYDDSSRDDATHTSVIGWLMSLVICAPFF